MGVRDERIITITPDDVASYETRRVIEHPGEPPRVRPLAPPKRVRASALVPQRGALRVLPPNTILEPVERAQIAVFVTQEQPRVHTLQWFTGSSYYNNTKRQLLANGAWWHGEETKDAFQQRLATQHRFTLAFPYLIKFSVFVRGQFQLAYCFYRNHPVTRDTDELYRSNLPNQDQQTAYLCMTGSLEQRISTAGSKHGLAEAVRVVDEVFWESAWNDHWMHWFSWYAERIPEVASPWEWERWSRKDPMRICTLPWVEFGRTVREEVRHLLQHSLEESPCTFDAFFHRIEAADAIDGPVAKVSAQATIRPSPTQHCYVGTQLFQVGDVLEVPPGIIATQPGGCRRAIEWFSERDEQARHVKLAGVDEPIPFIDRRGQLAFRATLVERVRSTIVVDGATIAPGSVLVLGADADFPNRPQGCHVVERVHEDRDGFAYAWFQDHQQPVIIAEGGKFYPQVTIVPKEDVDLNGVVRSGEVTLADGTVVRHGDRFFAIDAARVVSERQVGMIYGRGYQSAGVAKRCVKDAAHGGLWTLADTHDVLVGSLVPAPRHPIRSLRIGGCRVRVGRTRLSVDGGQPKYVETITPMFPDRNQYVQLGRSWYCLATNGSWSARLTFPKRIAMTRRGILVGRTAYHRGQQFFDTTTRRFISAAAFHVVEQDAIDVEDGKRQRLPCIRNGKLVDGLKSVMTELRVGGDTIRHGQRLRLREAHGAHATGTRFTVYFVMRSTDASPPMVATTCGQGFSLTRENAARFEWRDGMLWRAFPKEALCFYGNEHSVATTPEVSIFTKVLDRTKAVRGVRCVESGKVVGKDQDGHELRVGDRVRFVGCEQHYSNYSTDRAGKMLMTHPECVIVHTCGNDWAYVDLGQDVGQEPRGPGHVRGYHVIPHELRNSLTWWARLSWVNMQWCKFVSRGREPRPPEPQSAPSGTIVHPRCVAPGTLVGADYFTSIIRVGDRVRMGRYVSTRCVATARAHELLRGGGIGTVVHHDCDNWCYLDLGEDVGQAMRDGREDGRGYMDAYAEIPPHLRDDPTWWSRLALVRLHDCMIVYGGDYNALKQQAV